MPRELAGSIEAALAKKARPLTVREIASDLDLAPGVVAEIVWASPERFSWQPGGTWSLAARKTTVKPLIGIEQDDARVAVLSPTGGVELRAIRLAGGTTLRVLRRPLDSAAVFSVRSEGADLQLILNSSHEVFEELPMPFEGEGRDDYEELLEILLAAWAVHEAELPSAARRNLEDTRLLWGRRLLELLSAER